MCWFSVLKEKNILFLFHCLFFTSSASFPVPWAWSVMWRPTSPSSPTPQSSTSWRCGAVWATPSSSSSSGFPPSGRTTSGTGPTFASRLFSVSFGGHLVGEIVESWFFFLCVLLFMGVRNEVPLALPLHQPFLLTLQCDYSRRECQD